ncbi:MAG: autotransporter-associated beta strand repeat-containing protein, partial [Phycisphaerae bacterium]|nr:autotransporter-associated beta strand repeat-containing protein [Phycisphaerae bacterium]
MLNRISVTSVAVLVAILTVAGAVNAQYTFYNETFDSSNGGWTASAGGGAWAYTAGAWRADGTSGAGGNQNRYLTGTSITVGVSGQIVLNFDQLYNFEYDSGGPWDGGIVKVQTNSGGFTYLAGSAFTQNGYVRNVNVGNAGEVKNKDAFNASSGTTGYSASNKGVWVHTMANLGAFSAGDQIQIQFVGGWDEFTNNTPGWIVDNVQLAAGTSSATAWTGTTDNWRNSGVWTTPPPAGGSSSTVLAFGNSTIGAAYTSTYDSAGVFQLNGLNLNSTDTSWTNTVVPGSGAGNLNLVANGTLKPYVNQFGTGAFSLGNNITLGSSLAIGGPGTGALTFSGTLSESPAGAGVTVAGAGTVTLSGNNTLTGGVTVAAGALVLSGSNTFAGAIAVNGGALTLSHVAAAGSASSVTVAGGTLNLAAAVSIPTLSLTSGSMTVTAPATISTFNATGGTVTLSGSDLNVGTLKFSGGTSSISTGANAVVVSNKIDLKNGVTFATDSSHTFKAATISDSAIDTITLTGGTLTTSVFAITAGANLIGRWTMDESTGPFANTGTNSSIGTATLVPNGGALASVADKFGGKAAAISGGAYLKVANFNSVFDFTDSFTVSTWTQLNAGTAPWARPWGHKSNYNANDGWEVWSEGAGNSTFSVATVGDNRTTANMGFANGTWALLTYTFEKLNSTTVRVTAYTNGVQKAQWDKSAVAASATDLMFGHPGNVSDNQTWYGYFDDERLYNKALSASEVAAIYNGGNGDGSGGGGTATVANMRGAGSVAGQLTITNSISPATGTAPGKITFSGTSPALTLGSGTTYDWILAAQDGTSGGAGTNYSQVAITSGGMAAASGLTLNVTLTGTAANTSDDFWKFPHSWSLITNTGLADASGPFTTLNAPTIADGSWSTGTMGGNVVLSYSFTAPRYVWQGTTQTFATGTNWSPEGPPTHLAIAEFNAGTSFPPVLEASHAVGGIDFKTPGWTISGTDSSKVLSINAFGITSAGTGVNTISTPTTLLGSQPWTSTGAGNTLAIFGPVSGTGDLAINGTGNVVLGGANDFVGSVSLSGGGTLSVSADANLGNAANAINLGTGTLLITDNLTGTRGGSFAAGATINVAPGKAASLSGVFSGAEGFTKTGNGELTLGNAANTFGGAGKSITISAGTLNASADGNLGAAGTTVAINAGVFNASDTFSTAHPVTLGGGSIGVSATKTLTITSAITSGTLNKVGDGTLLLAGANTYAGTRIAAGTVAFTGTGLGGGNITFVGNSGLKWGTATTTDLSARLVFADGVSATLDTGANNVTLATAFGGSTSGKLVKAGSGTLSLAGANTYTGGTDISAGTLSFTGTGLGSAGAITFTGNSTLQWGAGMTADLSPRLALTDGVTATLDIGANTVILATSFGASTSGGVAKSGSGLLKISGANTFTGDFTLNGGTLAPMTTAVGTWPSLTSSPLGLGKLIVKGGVIGAGGSFGNDLVHIKNEVVLDGNVTMNMASGDHTNLFLDGPITLTGNRTITAGNSWWEGYQVNGEIRDGADDFTLTVTGGSYHIFAGQSTWSGGLIVSGAGMFGIGSSSTLDGGGNFVSGPFGVGTLTWRGGAWVGSTRTIRNALRLEADLAMSGYGGGTTDWYGQTTLTGNRTIATVGDWRFRGAVVDDGVGSWGVRFTGSITRFYGLDTYRGPLMVAGNGAVYNSNITRTGGTIFYGGTLYMGASSDTAPFTKGPLGVGAVTVTADGGTLLSDGATARSLDNDFAVGGYFTLGSAGYGTLTLNGNVTVANGRTLATA